MIEAWARGAYLEVKSQLLAGGIASPAATVSAIIQEATAASPQMVAGWRQGEGDLLPPPSPFLLAAASPSPSLMEPRQAFGMPPPVTAARPSENDEAFVIRRVSDGCGDVWGSGGGAEESATGEQPLPMAAITGATPAGVKCGDVTEGRVCVGVIIQASWTESLGPDALTLSLPKGAMVSSSLSLTLTLTHCVPPQRSDSLIVLGDTLLGAGP